MVELPMSKVKAERLNPKKIILFSNPKTGKTTAAAALEDNLIIDVESGSSFLDARKIDVLKIAIEQNKTPLTVLKEIRDKVKEANAEKGSFVYKYITVDTVSALEDISIEALSLILNEIGQLCDTLIILGHIKSKLVEKEGKEMESRGLDLTGRLASILCSQVDAVGYVFRDENKTKVNFAPSESLVVGSRPEHLKNKIITLIESDADGNLIIDWSKIFIN